MGQKCYFDNKNKHEGFSYFHDALEIMIINSVVYSIGFDLARCPVFILNDLSICSETSFELIMRYLDVADIEWSFENKYCNGRELTIKTEETFYLDVFMIKEIIGYQKSRYFNGL